MSSVYDLLSADLTREFTWRLREIHQLRSTISDIETGRKETLIRASFVLLYAHWEGFIKRSAELFFEHLVKLNKPLHQLPDGAKVVCIRREVYHAFTHGGRSNRQVMGLLELIAQSKVKKLLGKHIKNLVSTANMTFDEFEDVCVLFGLDAVEFEEHRQLIDRILIHRRHQIAHGLYLRVEYEDFISTSDRVISVIRMFKNKMENVFLGITEGAQ